MEEAANHWPYYPSKFKTFVEVLGENGYWVGSVGKGWAPGNPGKINGKERELTGPKFNECKLTPPTTGISNNDYTKNFEAFLEKRPEGMPFCFWYGSYEPHRRYEFESGIKKGKKNISDINEVPHFWPDVDTIRKDMLDYAYEIEYFDIHLQRMLQKLDEIGELNNTLVLVTSDNGMPFPRAKSDVYEYSNHMPLAVMWSNGIKKPGRVVSDYVSFIDFAPTFLKLVDINAQKNGMQPITGRSLTEIFFSGKDGTIIPERDFILVGKERHDVGRPNDQGYPVRGIINKDYLYLHNFKPDRWPEGNPETGYLCCGGSPTKTHILDTRRKKGVLKYWQLSFGKRPEEELYNIKNDPFCMNNLAQDKNYTRLKTDLQIKMNQMLIEQHDPRVLGNGYIFDNYKFSWDAVRNYYNRYMAGEDIPTPWVNKTDYDKYLIRNDSDLLE